MKTTSVQQEQINIPAVSSGVFYNAFVKSLENRRLRHFFFVPRDRVLDPFFKNKKKTQGRPKKLLQNQIRTFRLTEFEKQERQKKADLMKLKFSDYARTKLLLQ